MFRIYTKILCSDLKTIAIAHSLCLSLSMKLARSLTALCLPFCLSACVNQVPINAKEDLLASFEAEGPQVEGVQGTLLKSAREATGRGEYAKAVQLYGQLLGMDKENLYYQLGLADNLRRSGEAEAAGAIYTQISAAHPENMDAKEGKGLAQLYLGEFDEAGAVLAEVHAEDKTRWRTLNGLGILLVERGQVGDAIAYFDEALKHTGNRASVYNNIGLAYAINDEPKEALDALVKGIDAADPKSPIKQQIELNLALVMGIFGDMDAAEKILSEHLPEPAVANNLGLYAYLANNQSLAKSYLNTALSRSPSHYKRAWENLDAITRSTKSGKKDSKKRKPKAKVLKVE